MNNSLKILATLGLLMLITLGYGQDQIELSENKNRILENESPLSIANNKPQFFKHFSVYGGLLDNVEYLGHPFVNFQLEYFISKGIAIEYNKRLGLGGHTNYGRLGVNFILNPNSDSRFKYYVGILGAMTQHFYFDMPLGISYSGIEGYVVKLGLRYHYMPDDYEPANAILAEILVGWRF